MAANWDEAHSCWLNGKEGGGLPLMEKPSAATRVRTERLLQRRLRRLVQALLHARRDPV